MYIKNLSLQSIIILKNIFICFFILLIINIISNLTSDTRIYKIIKNSSEAGELLQFKNLDNDMFTECAMLYMSMSREEIPKDLFGSRWNLSEGNHTCDEVRILLKNENQRSYQEVARDPVIVKYHNGSRYIFSLMAAIFEFELIRNIFLLLSITTPILLGISIIKGSGINAIKIIYPILALFYIGFSLNNLGSNIAHAPGFIFPGLLLIYLSWNSNKYLCFNSRVKIYVFIAAACTYFDILTGPLPFYLAITIILNYFLFKGDKWVNEILNIIIIFIFTFIVLESLRLIIGSILFGINEFEIFRIEISQRLSNSVGDKEITYFDVLSKIWINKKIYFYNSNMSAAFIILTSSACWLIALIKTLFLKTEARKGIYVLLVGSLVIMIWFRIFENHTYVHYGFMGRLILIPIAAGLSAFILAFPLNNKAYLIPLLLILCTGFFEILNKNLDNIEVKNIKKYEKYIDITSCSNDLNIKSDGLKDLVYEISFNNYALLNLNKVNKIVIGRETPFGAYKTTPDSFPLAVLNKEGIVLSANNREINLRIVNSEPILVAFCADGLENNSTKYKIFFETISGYAFESNYFFNK